MLLLRQIPTSLFTSGLRLRSNASAADTHRGVAVHGDIDIVPAHTTSKWTLRDKDTALIVRVCRTTLAEAALQSGVDPSNALLLNRFQVRDPQIEQLAWG